ncbi:hypothetical protein [Streptomyces sp. NPDC089799]|uniref:hypothetical protein n=1 Tax=Streptomyces sp. NPDC089799 TaxID=3155066 RepID=UPI0034475CA6
MQPTPSAVFLESPATRLIDLAIRAREGGRDGSSLDDEIRRYNRVVRNSWRADWNCPPYTAAAMLDLIAVVVATPGPLVPLPASFEEKLARAADGMDQAEYLHALAEMVRILDREQPAAYDELAMAAWELSLLFPHLNGFSAELDDGGHPSFAAAVASGVLNEHPYCVEPAVPYTTEAQLGLTLFPDEHSLGRYVPWATRDRLRELLDVVNDHMQREHS